MYSREALTGEKVSKKRATTVAIVAVLVALCVGGGIGGAIGWHVTKQNQKLPSTGTVNFPLNYPYIY